MNAGLRKLLAQISSAMLLLAITIGLSACGGSEEASNGNTTPPTAGASGPTSAGSSKEGVTAKDEKSKESSSGSADNQKSTPGNPKGGGNAQKQNVGFKPVSPIRPLFSSSTSGIVVESPTVVVARRSNQLDSLMSRQVAGSSDPMSQIQTSLKRSQVIAVVAPSSAPGSRLSVTSVLNNGDKTKVYAVLIQPGKGCKVAGGENVRPTAWVETRRLPGETSVELVKKSSGC